MATTQKTKVADLESDVLLPVPTAAPPDIFARQQNVDWLIGRETCGFYTKSGKATVLMFGSLSIDVS